MRTTVLIDGYNLYYGCLQHSPYKWLNVRELVTRIVRIQQPEAVVTDVKFFTAPVMAKLATHGQGSSEAQQTYHRALLAANVEVVLGRHSLEPSSAPAFIQNLPANRAELLRIWKLSEKETDTNLAVAALQECYKHRCEQIVFVSNDSDLTPVLNAIKCDFPGISIGVISPVLESGNRPASGSLSNIASWSRKHIRLDELASAQFPARVPTKKKPADKPAYW